MTSATTSGAFYATWWLAPRSAFLTGSMLASVSSPSRTIEGFVNEGSVYPRRRVASSSDGRH